MDWRNHLPSSAAAHSKGSGYVPSLLVARAQSRADRLSHAATSTDLPTFDMAAVERPAVLFEAAFRTVGVAPTVVPACARCRALRKSRLQQLSLQLSALVTVIRRAACQREQPDRECSRALQHTDEVSCRYAASGTARALASACRSRASMIRSA